MIQHVNFDMEWVISVIFCCWLALFAYRLKPRQNNPDKHFRSKSISFAHPSLALTPWQRQWFNPGPCKSQALLWGGPPNWDKWESFPEGGLWNAEQVCQWPLTSCFYRHESWPHVNPCSSVAFPTWLWSPLMVFSHGSPPSNQILRDWRGGFAHWRNGVWSFKLVLESSLSSWANKSANTIRVRWAGAPGGCHSLLCWAGSYRRQCCHTFIQLYIT